MAKVTKAVILTAGFGTRFLPITKSIPKEMLPVVDKPIIQFVVEELVEAGIKDIIFIVSPYKQAIRDYFSPHPTLEAILKKSGKENEFSEVKKISTLANFSFICQKQTRGTGDAILTARAFVGNKPFLVLFGDDFIVAKPSRTKQLIEAFEKYQASVLGSIETKNPEDGARYGFVVGQLVSRGIFKIERLVEKPGVGKAPSSLAIVSGYVFTPEIFAALKKAQKKIGTKRELHYIDGLNILQKVQPIYALKFQNARYYDTGNKLGYLKTVVEFGLKNKDFGVEFRKFLQKLTRK